MCFSEGLVSVCDVSDSKSNSVEIVRVALDAAKVLGVEHFEVKVVEATSFNSTLLADLQHVWVDVRDSNLYRELWKTIKTNDMIKE